MVALDPARLRRKFLKAVNYIFKRRVLINPNVKFLYARYIYIGAYYVIPVVRLSVCLCLSVCPSVPVRTLTPKVFNFHVSYLVHWYRLWRRCVATYVCHLKVVAMATRMLFSMSQHNSVYIPSCLGVYCAHLSSCSFLVLSFCLQWLLVASLLC